MFGSRISLKSLAIMCRSLSTMLHSGVEIRKAFKLAANKTGDLHCRRALAEITNQIQQGDDVSAAMRSQGGFFPDLLIDMVSVAEGTGMLPEVLNQLADHYDDNLKLRKSFLASIAWPIFQLVAAIFVIALLILVLGLVLQGGESMGLDHLVFGLLGPKGAVIWLSCTFGFFLGLFVIYQVIKKALGGKKFLDPLLMRIPVLGNCMRSFAIARFSWAFYLTQQTGMPVTASLRAALKATTNGAFIAGGHSILESIESGETLTVALAESGLFPDEFIEMVDVGETSGTVPEALHRLSPQFEEQARRSLKTLTAALGMLVWLTVAVFIVIFIFRFVLGYVGMINDLVQGT